MNCLSTCVGIWKKRDWWTNKKKRKENHDVWLCWQDLCSQVTGSVVRRSINKAVEHVKVKKKKKTHWQFWVLSSKHNLSCAFDVSGVSKWPFWFVFTCRFDVIRFLFSSLSLKFNAFVSINVDSNESIEPEWFVCQLLFTIEAILKVLCAKSNVNFISHVDCFCIFDECARLLVIAALLTNCFVQQKIVYDAN